MLINLLILSFTFIISCDARYIYIFFKTARKENNISLTITKYCKRKKIDETA